MGIDSSVEILASELAQIVKSVFGTMVNMEVDECGTHWFPGGNRLTSAVHLTGDWKGAVLLECDWLVACRFASRFLSLDPSDTPDDVVRDVLGELANMIGGNVKCVLKSGIQLSMPSVVDGSNYGLRVCGAEIKDRLAFQCADGLFWITVLTSDPDVTTLSIDKSQERLQSLMHGRSPGGA
jgi:chemotaxis protein CheX